MAFPDADLQHRDVAKWRCPTRVRQVFLAAARKPAAQARKMAEFLACAAGLHLGMSCQENSSHPMSTPCWDRLGFVAGVRFPVGPYRSQALFTIIVVVHGPCRCGVLLRRSAAGGGDLAHLAGCSGKRQDAASTAHATRERCYHLSQAPKLFLQEPYV